MRKNPFLKRLPLLLFAALGLWLWKAGFVTQERELVWQLGADRASLREVEIQLWDTRGELLKREEFFFQGSPPGADLVQRLPLKQGHYTARIFLRREASGGIEQQVQPIDIGSAETYALRLSGGARDGAGTR